MKKLVAVITVFLISFLFISRAAIINVAVADFTFSPNNFTAQIGDTVRFNWVSGFHTTTSTSVPAGAATWDTLITSLGATYSYRITHAGNYSYTCLVHFGMDGSFTVSAATPVKLIDFSAIHSGSHIQITWKTATEENVDYFAVQRSYDGTLFEVIGNLAAFGNSTVQQQYSFTDKTFMSARRFVYYRLLSVDKDKKEQYSRILLHKNNLSGRNRFITRLYPNPIRAHDHLQLYFDSDKTHQLVITIHDGVGRLIHTKILHAREGVNQTHLPLPSLHRGMYLFSFLLEGKKESYKIQVR